MAEAGPNLTAQTQARDQITVAIDVVLSQVLQQATTATNHQQQTTTGVVIVLVELQVLGQSIDAGGQQGNLRLRGTGIGFVQAVLLEEFGLLLSGQCHEYFSFISVHIIVTLKPALGAVLVRAATAVNRSR